MYWGVNKGVTEIPTDVPAGATWVDLSRNRITTIRAGSLSHLAWCGELWLENNQISEIDPAAFTGLTSLKELDLHYNKLTHISPGTFSGLTSLSVLYLHNNRLTGLSSYLFLDLPRPLTLGLGKPCNNDPDNLFLCDESLCWLKQEEQDGTVWFYDDLPKCSNSISWQSFTCPSGKIH